MSLFSNLGEKVERFKQKAVSASEEQAEFTCQACGEPVYTDQETCPHCGADAVVRVEPAAEGADPTRGGEGDSGAGEAGSAGEGGGADR